MLNNHAIFLIALGCFFSVLNLADEDISHNKRSRSTRPISEAASSDDWCLSHLNADEKKQLQREIASVFTKYQQSKGPKDPKQLQDALSKTIESRFDMGGAKTPAALAAVMSQQLQDLAQVTKFYESLSAIEKGEKLGSDKQSLELESIAKDYEALKKIGLRFDPEKREWDLSGLTKEPFDLSSAPQEAKSAMSRLLSPDLAEKFFNSDRSEAFNVGNFVVRPPFEPLGGKRTSEFSVVTQEKQDADIQAQLDRLLSEKEQFLKASKEANGFWNSIQGRAAEAWLGWERGHEGKTAPEIEREGAFKAMRQTAHNLRGLFGVSDESVRDLNSVLQDTLKQDSAGLAALDSKLSQTISTLKTARNIAIAGGVILATGGVAAPGLTATLLGAGSTGAVAGATTGTVGAAMATAVGMSAIPAAINIGIDVWNGKKISCAAMAELANRGPQVVTNTLMAAAFAGGGGALAAAGSQLLAVVSPYVGQAGAGLISSGAQIGTGAAFLGLGATGLYQAGNEAYRLYQEANAAEARGDLATAEELRAEAFKLAAETGVNAVEAAYGASQLVRGARQASRHTVGTTEQSFAPSSAVPDSPQATRPPAGVQIDIAQPKPTYSPPPRGRPVGHTEYETPNGLWIGGANGAVEPKSVRRHVAQLDPLGPKFRGWSGPDIDAAVASPTFVRSGLRDLALDQPATAYYRKDGSYVVVNDVNGRIVQVSGPDDPPVFPPGASTILSRGSVEVKGTGEILRPWQDNAGAPEGVSWPRGEGYFELPGTYPQTR